MPKAKRAPASKKKGCCKKTKKGPFCECAPGKKKVCKFPVFPGQTCTLSNGKPGAICPKNGQCYSLETINRAAQSIKKMDCSTGTCRLK